MHASLLAMQLVGGMEMQNTFPPTTHCHLVSHFYSHIFLACHLVAPAAAYQVRRDVTDNKNVAGTGRHVPPVSAECRLSIKPRTDLINSSL